MFFKLSLKRGRPRSTGKVIRIPERSRRSPLLRHYLIRTRLEPEAEGSQEVKTVAWNQNPGRNPTIDSLYSS